MRENAWKAEPAKQIRPPKTIAGADRGLDCPEVWGKMKEKETDEDKRKKDKDKEKETKKE